MNATLDRLHDVADRVEAFEAARQRDPCAPLSAFLPPTDDPAHDNVLCELARVDLELGWRRGLRPSLDAVLAGHPRLSSDEELRAQLAFEHWRLRVESGDSPSPAEYAIHGIDATGWPAPVGATRVVPADHDLQRAASAYCRFREEGGDLDEVFASACVSPAAADLFGQMHATRPVDAQRLAEAAVAMPEAGASFGLFHLESELGRGAFGRVFLARQIGLADRLVALKVAPGTMDESGTLARMQHTNIMPIHSVHAEGPLRAVCMPYFGAATLADALRELKSLPSVPHSGQH
ncbi:MAG: hypothetical protein K2W96_22635, partial [Gemmataceae bacterium]|nr:hypothetical protein [Gemmataceae bacterium]